MSRLSFFTSPKKKETPGDKGICVFAGMHQLVIWCCFVFLGDHRERPSSTQSHAGHSEATVSTEVLGRKRGGEVGRRGGKEVPGKYIWSQWGATIGSAILDCDLVS